MRDFLSSYLDSRAGEIVNVEGEVMGKHDGLMYYTVGQKVNMANQREKCERGLIDM